MTASTTQDLQSQISSQVSWGSANGCVQNIETNDFGELVPGPSAATLGAFAALPGAEASTDTHGNKVWVGCVTTNTELASVDAQGTSDMSDGSATLPLADVSIGVTNANAGKINGGAVGCEVQAGQAVAGSCPLERGAAGQSLLTDAEPGTTELNWQYQLSLPANQPVGHYNGGVVVLTATAGDSSGGGGGGSAPSNLTAPALSTTEPRYGAPLSTTNGTWTNNPTSYTYQWEDCNGQGEECVRVSGASSSTYTPVEGDISQMLRVTVTASNAFGSESTSSPAAMVISVPPANNTVPALSNINPQQGLSESVSTGTWINSPTSFTYQWQDCNSSGEDCTNIAGATSSSYTPVEADLGHTLCAVVTASNDSGSTAVSSEASQLVSESGSLVYTTEIGGAGAGIGQFNHPSGVAIDSNGRLWVADDENDRIEEFSENGDFIKTFGSSGSGDGQLSHPYAIAVDAKDDVWVVDHGNNRVEEFNENGDFVRAFGASGPGEGQFSPSPEGIAVDSHGNVWVSDTYNGRIEEFTENGGFIKTVGGAGSGEGELGEPENLAISSNGDVYVADWEYDRVVEFNEAGVYVREFGSSGSANGQLSSPYGLAIDSNGDVWVADTANERVEKFSPTGEYLYKFAPAVAGELSFSYPDGLAADSHGDIWITSTENGFVEEWGP